MPHARTILSTPRNTQPVSHHMLSRAVSSGMSSSTGVYKPPRSHFGFPTLFHPHLSVLYLLRQTIQSYLSTLLAHSVKQYIVRTKQVSVEEVVLRPHSADIADMHHIIALCIDERCIQVLRQRNHLSTLR